MLKKKSLAKPVAGLVALLLLTFLLPLFVFAQNYSGNALLRAENGTKVYIIHNQKKRWIKNIEIFNSYNFKWPNVKIVSEKELAGIHENKLIRLKGDVKVYLIDENNRKDYIKSAEEFESRGFNWADIAEVNQGELESYEEKSFVVTTTPAPTVSFLPTVKATPLPVKINYDLPFPDYVRADWLISQIPVNFGRLGQKITFKYSDKEADRVENFRLYEKKPGGQYFYRIAEFEQVPSTGCEDFDVDGDWMITEAGQCGYWAIQKIVPPGGREATAYLPAADYSEGEYTYYVVGVNKDGLETRQSPETKLVFLGTTGIFSPVDNQPSAEAYPTFKWSVAGGWPTGAIADYQIQISDNKNAQSPFWAKILKVPAGKSEQSFTYDGSGLNPASKYQVFIYGYYRQSESDPDYISIPLTIPEFWIRTTGQRVSLWSFLKGVIFPFSKVRP